MSSSFIPDLYTYASPDEVFHVCGPSCQHDFLNDSIKLRSIHVSKVHVSKVHVSNTRMPVQLFTFEGNFIDRNHNNKVVEFEFEIHRIVKEEIKNMDLNESCFVLKGLDENLYCVKITLDVSDNKVKSFVPTKINPSALEQNLKGSVPHNVLKMAFVAMSIDI